MMAIVEWLCQSQLRILGCLENKDPKDSQNLKTKTPQSFLHFFLWEGEGRPLLNNNRKSLN